MTERLVPYRSPSQVHDDNAVMAVLALLGIGGAHLFVGASNFILLAVAVWLAIVIASLTSEAIGVWRARRRGADLLTRAEWYQRSYFERAAAPLWQSAAPVAMVTSYTGSLALLALVPLEHWPWVPVGTVAAGLLGALSGLYAWSYSRSYVAAAQGDPKQAPAPSPFLQVAMRHYAGYALGLAAALIAATLIPDRRVAALAIAPAFLVGKLFSDVLAPTAYYSTTAEAPRTLIALISGTVFSIVWWGLPLGGLLSIQIGAMENVMDASDYTFAFGLTAIGASSFYLFLVGLLLATRGQKR